MTLSYESIVDGLVRAGVPRVAAEARARRECGVTDAAQAEELERDERLLEKAEQAEIIRLCTIVHLTYYNRSQFRPAKQTPGLPDLWLVHETLPIATWWETKRQVGGRYSDAQVTFREGCERAGIPHASGDRYHFAAWLREHKLVYPGTRYPPEPILTLSAAAL